MFGYADLGLFTKSFFLVAAIIVLLAAIKKKVLLAWYRTIMMPLEKVATKESGDSLRNWTRPVREDCPICSITLPLGPKETSTRPCCGKTVCRGCLVSQVKASLDAEDMVKASRCPFCRAEPTDEESTNKQIVKLANAGNHVALHKVAGWYFEGERGIEQDKAEGIKLYLRAVEAGSPDAALKIGTCYADGDGVDRDDEKALRYMEQAAERGHFLAYFSIGILLRRRGDVQGAVINFRKAAMSGVCDDELFRTLRSSYSNGHMTKEEYMSTLREHQSAVDSMKSEARKKYKKIMKRSPGNRLVLCPDTIRKVWAE